MSLNPVQTIVFCGKGGVGKTLSAASLGVFLAKNREKTLLVDWDGGHRMAATLGIGMIPANTVYEVDPCLSILVINNPTYKNALQVKAEGLDLDQYFDQFPGHLGLVALADALLVFFGIPIDTPTLHKFAVLVGILSSLSRQEFTNVVLDVEPTAGFERLLSHAATMVKTLQNLRRRGTILFASIVMRWREVEDYVSGEYFEHLEEYSRDILSVVALLKKAKYVLVCMPEAGPVEQLFEVRDIVRKSGGRVYGYVVNNIRGETHEKQSMIPLNVLHIPRVLIPRRNELHNRGDARATLFEIGKALHDGLLKKRALSRR